MSLQKSFFLVKIYAYKFAYIETFYYLCSSKGTRERGRSTIGSRRAEYMREVCFANEK